MLSSLGVCCSSWIVTSRGSTGRCWICPMGLPFAKVLSSNKMVSRIGCIKKWAWFLAHKLEDLNWSCLFNPLPTWQFLDVPPGVLSKVFFASHITFFVCQRAHSNRSGWRAFYSWFTRSVGYSYLNSLPQACLSDTSGFCGCYGYGILWESRCSSCWSNCCGGKPELELSPTCCF